MIAFFLLSFLEYDTIIMKEMVNFMRIKEKDENYNFVSEIKSLNEVIKGKIEIRQMLW